MHQINLRQPACPCWKAFSLFLKREGSTKSQPRASRASSFLRSGSCRKERSFILIPSAVTVTSAGGWAASSNRRRIIFPGCPHQTLLGFCLSELEPLSSEQQLCLLAPVVLQSLKDDKNGDD
ncbi:hypothetical protein JZ751_028035 [Albula glossodonta]|uniref:Uncharacterized protein n=1 Tax=Albula glossodonta TaxID=121402 RepID=A0A8T2PKS2_9TELE|nr:hypothetical protein JZ751_028035 [Albula glossodonta]